MNTINELTTPNGAFAADAAKATTQTQARGASEPVKTVTGKLGCVDEQRESVVSSSDQVGADVKADASGNANQQVVSASGLAQNPVTTPSKAEFQSVQTAVVNFVWQAMNYMRGNFEAWEFRAFLFALLVYLQCSRVIKFKIDNFEGQVEPNFDYSRFEFPEGYSLETHFQWYAPQIGYCLEPKFLFQNVLKNHEDSAELPRVLNLALEQLVSSSAFCNTGWNSVLKGIFEGVDFTTQKLGRTELERGKKLTSVMKALSRLELELDQNSAQFAEAIEFFTQMVASSAGKSGGEFVTPSAVSELLAKLATNGVNNASSVYDPCCGSGGLLCKTAELINTESLTLYGQDINRESYRSALANLTLHGLSPKQLDLHLGNTLLEPAPQHVGKKFPVVVSHPPYALMVDREKVNELACDSRFLGLPITRTADALFVLHCLSHLESDGTCAVVVPDGLLVRPVEAKFRNYLVSNNFVKAVVSLPGNIFYGTGTKCSILVLKRESTSDKIQFIDASQFVERTDKQGTVDKRLKSNSLSAEGIEKVLSAYAQAKEIPGFSKLTPINEVVENKSVLAVNIYVEEADEEEKTQLDLDLALKTFAKFKATTEGQSEKLQDVLNSLLNKASAKDDQTESVESRLQRWKLKPEDVAKELGVDLANLEAVQRAVQSYQPDAPLQVKDALLIPTCKVVQYLYGSVLLTVQQAGEKVSTHSVWAKDLEDGSVAFFAGGVKPTKYVKFEDPHLGEAALVVRVGNAGLVTYYNGPKVVSGSYAFVGRDNLVLTKYLYHALKNLEPVLKRSASGTAVRSLSSKFLMEKTVLIPSLEKQAEIVAQLEHVEALQTALEAGLEQAAQLEGQLRDYLISESSFTNS